MTLRCLWIAPLLWLLLSAGAWGKPFVPPSDGTILEQLPNRPTDPAARETRRLRDLWQKHPEDLTVAVQLARHYYQQALGEGDPRPVGYAQATLARWWGLPEPPGEVLLLRAFLGQYRHDFGGALADLDKLLRREPDHPEAQSLRAAIHLVQARYDEAAADCRGLGVRGAPLMAQACSLTVAALTGQARPSYRALAGALATRPEASKEQKLWILTRLGEIAQRLGEERLAENHYRQALALGIRDVFLLAAYADLLLDQGRAAETASLLKDGRRADVLLLRLALAEQALSRPQAAESRDALAARFHEARLRGDALHQQEEARFTLYLLGQPLAALRLAEANWRVQREPRDARILLEAALAARQPAAAQPVLDWLSRWGNEEPRLRQLAEQLGKLPR